MTVSIIITICILLLLAYIFDITSTKTKIPSVILLLVLGWGVKQGASFFDFQIPNLNPVLPILGTVGLILIVLEGSLELELNKTKLPLIGKSSLVALLPMLSIIFVLAYALQYFGGSTFKTALINAIPLSIISSAIAIPSARNLSKKNKEFITYESSLSDIFGVIFFNFIVLNGSIGSRSIGGFILELVMILVISFIATLALAYFLDKIKHHIKFIPIMLMVILIYTVSKIYHLPGLVFILLFGLFLGNIDELKNFSVIRKFHSIDFDNEVQKFQELTTEFAFLIRSLFFLLFGFLIETSELLNSKTIVWALAITVGIFSIRAIFLKLFKLAFNPLFYLAPRGLITILLFLSIPLSQQIETANKSLIIQVIILSALLMMVGLMKQKEYENEVEED